MNNVMVTKVIFEGKKAAGVELVQGGSTKKFRAGIICDHGWKF